MDRFALMERVKNGDKDAFREIFRVYSKPVYDTALKHTDDPEEAKAIVKRVFSIAYDTLLKEPYYGDFSAWFQTLAELQVCEWQAREKLEARRAKQAQKQQKKNAGDAPQAEDTPQAAQATPVLEKKQVPVGTVLLRVLVMLLRVVVTAGLLWAIIGMLGALHILEAPNWGYMWFNQNLFELF